MEPSSTAKANTTAKPSTSSGTVRKRSGTIFVLTDTQKADIKKTFDQFDVHSTGFIEVRQLKIAIRSLGFEPKEEEIQILITQFDKNGTGRISYNDFLHLMSIKLSEKDTKDQILKAFRLFDDDNTGKISYENLKKVASELGEELTDEDLKLMIFEADLDHDGEVSLDEFLNIMKKTNLY